MRQHACMSHRCHHLSCVDCGATVPASRNGRRKRCQPCQRVYDNAETRKRDKARRGRLRAAQAACEHGLPEYEVLRDNGHRCRACGVVLWLDAGMAPYYCRHCHNSDEVVSVIVGVFGMLIGACIGDIRDCRVCGRPCVSGRQGRNTSTCSRACGREYGRQKSRDRYERLTGVRLVPVSASRSCKYCRCSIQTKHRNGRGRSSCDECNLYRGDYKSRAILYGVPYTHVSRRMVFERDGWRCQLCGHAVLRKAKRHKVTGRLHPRTASLDHIIPMVRGGPHVEQNCQCACLSCNVRKNAKLIGQMRLF
jgi:hypothetical protein